MCCANSKIQILFMTKQACHFFPSLFCFCISKLQVSMAKCSVLELSVLLVDSYDRVLQITPQASMVALAQYNCLGVGQLAIIECLGHYYIFIMNQAALTPSFDNVPQQYCLWLRHNFCRRVQGPSNIFSQLVFQCITTPGSL